MTAEGILNAVLKVQTAVEKTSTPTKPIKVIQTLNGSANKGKKFPATPPSNEDVLAILDAIYDPTIHGTMKWATKWGTIRLRNRALIVLLWRSGLRIHEALLLKPIDIDFEHCTVTVVRGKGGKRRMSGITRGALVELNTWLHVRALAGFTIEQPVFCTVEGPTKGGPLYQAYVRQALRDLAKKAGVTRRVAPHQLRHALAVDMARKHVSIPIVSRQLGHSNIATTATYLVGLSDVEVFEAMEGMDFGGRS